MAGTDSYTSRGGGSDATRQRRAQDQKMWADMLKMINSATPQTMLGYGIGKLLRGAWDHYLDRKAENTDTDDNKGTVQGRADNTAYTVGGIDPRTATVDEGQTIYGVAPTKGLLGNGILGDFMAKNPNNVIALGQQQTTQEVTQPNGQKDSTTTTGTYAFNPNDYAIRTPERMTLNEMAARQILGSNDPYGLNSKKAPLGNINLRY